MPSRRSHGKSHHGCQRCKTMRVKCSEHRPKCLRCQKARVDCVYHDLLAMNHNPFRASPSPCSASTSLVSSRETSSGNSPTRTLKIDQDHEIFEYYGLYVAGSVPMLSRAENMQRWHLAVQKHAFNQTYLRSSILAVACLHRAIHTFEDRQKNILLALQYQEKATSQFVPILNKVSEDTCEPAVACAAMLCCITFAVPRAMEKIPNQAYDVISNSLQIISLFQGLTLLFRIGWYHKYDNNISANIRRNVLATMKVEIIPNPDLESSLDALAASAKETLKEKDYAFYAYAIEQMKENYGRRAARPLEATLLATFMVNMPKRYFEDLKQQNPYALVLLAHWAAGLHVNRASPGTVWWSRDWGVSAVASIADLMDLQWQPHLEWPRRRVGLLE